jgi:hypothetical protein
VIFLGYTILMLAVILFAELLCRILGPTEDDT